MIKQHDSIEIDKENLALSAMMQFSRLRFMSGSRKFQSWTELSNWANNGYVLKWMENHQI